MPQEQRQIELTFLNGQGGVAIATGNNAAWICQCGYKNPLIGRSGETMVECPTCRRNYQVVPEDNVPLKRVLYVKEI